MTQRIRSSSRCPSKRSRSKKGFRRGLTGLYYYLLTHIILNDRVNIYFNPEFSVSLSADAIHCIIGSIEVVTKTLEHV